MFASGRCQHIMRARMHTHPATQIHVPCKKKHTYLQKQTHTCMRFTHSVVTTRTHPQINYLHVWRGNHLNQCTKRFTKFAKVNIQMVHQREERERERRKLWFFSPWMWAVCLDKNRTEWLWNSTFLLHICLLWKCISCILTLDLVTSSLPPGHRIYKWVRTLNRISLCTQAATGKGGSTLDRRFVVLSGLSMSSQQNIQAVYSQT